MRELKDHVVEGDENPQLTITVTDEPDASGVNHRYEISRFDVINNPSLKHRLGDFTKVIIVFQYGPIQEVRVNGITNEALLAIVIDRLRSFQAGPFPSEENAAALTQCKGALSLLKSRTRDRIRRGVEGQTKP